MLTVRRGQLDALGAVLYDDYVGRLADTLSGERYAECLRRALPAGRGRADVERAVREQVARARSLGFECEGDVTPFVLLTFCLDEEFKATGLYAWVDELLRETELDAEERMDGVYALLPEKERDLCFVQTEGE